MKSGERCSFNCAVEWFDAVNTVLNNYSWVLWFVHRSYYLRHLSSTERKSEKIQAWTGFEPMTCATPVQCSTSWAVKPTKMTSSQWAWKLNWSSTAPVSQRSWVRIPFKPGFFQTFFRYCSNSVNNNYDEQTIICFCPQFKCVSFTYYLSYTPKWFT